VKRYVFACAFMALAAAGGSAQTLREQCAPASREQVLAFCQNVADAATILQPRLGIALSGGNPVPGTASTMGMRIGTLPRIGIGLRVSAAETDLPPVEHVNDDDDVAFPLGSINGDVTVGLFSGFTVAPTVGGVGALDLLGSIGIMPLPGGEGFDDSSPLTWAAGARLGILRESFTAPGVSVSAMYRTLDDVAYGSEDLSDRDAFFRITNYDVMSLRAAVGKRVLGFGLTAGAGYDKYNADITAVVRDPTVVQPTRTLTLQEGGMSTSRVSLFGNVSFTLLILNMSAEAGWQQGGDAITGASDKLDKGALFGGIAIRIQI
jgi:hypothetical protein